MARRKIDPKRQKLIDQLKANGIEIGSDWPTASLEEMARFTPDPKAEKSEVYGSPKRNRRRGPARIEFHSPDLIQMTQGSGELITSNAHAKYLAGVVSEGMGHPERNLDNEQLFPEHHLTPGANPEHAQLRAWARNTTGVDADWPVDALRTLRKYTEE